GYDEPSHSVDGMHLEHRPAFTHQLKRVVLGKCLGRRASDRAVPHRITHFAMIVFSDSRSARLTASQRFHATGSIRFLISRSTQSRRSFGSIASSSQHSLYLAVNHLKRGSLRLLATGNDGSSTTCSLVSLKRHMMAVIVGKPRRQVLLRHEQAGGIEVANVE